MNFQRAFNTVEQLINGFIAALPDLLLALLIILLAVFIGRRVQRLVIGLTERQHRARNLGVLLGKLAQSGVIITGGLVAMTVVFPSFQPGDLIQLLGISSIAIGFAFRDVFQNFLAGILLLLTVPFSIGDQISVDDFEGTIEDIQTRATTIKTYDGRRIVIPNSDLFTKSVTVHTAFMQRRMECEIKVSCKEDAARLKRLIQLALNSVEGVLPEPAVEVFLVALDDAGMTLRIYWWTGGARHLQVLQVQDRVLTLLKNTLIEHDIDLFPPSPMLIQMVGDGYDQHLKHHVRVVDEKVS